MAGAQKGWFASQSLKFLVIMFSLIFGIVGMCTYWYIQSISYVTTDNAYVETDLSPVNTRMMGFIREVFVRENQEVKKGEALIKLDDVDTKLELGYKEAKLKKAQADFERAKHLQAQRALSESDFEMAQATLAGMTADVEGSLLKLKFTDVVAPIDGVVAKRSAQPGQFVQPGQTLLLVVPTDRSWIRANFKENQIRHIKVGQPVHLTVDAYPGEVWEGEVEYIYPSSVASMSIMPPENVTGNFTKVVQRFPVKISFKQKKDRPLLPGMSVEPSVRIR